MKIRSITSFYDPGAADAGETLDLLSRFARTAEKRFGDAGIETQSADLHNPIRRDVPVWLPGKRSATGAKTGGEGAGTGIQISLHGSGFA